jgi:Protein of unknown function (DUF3892)
MGFKPLQTRGGVEAISLGKYGSPTRRSAIKPTFDNDGPIRAKDRHPACLLVEVRLKHGAGGRTVAVIVAFHSGRKYLKTEADGYSPDNLLALPECP